MMSAIPMATVPAETTHEGQALLRSSLHRLTKRFQTLWVVAAWFLLAFTVSGHTEKFKSPDILILGDSQITFGSGPVFLDFFQDIKAHCSPDNVQKQYLKKLGEMSVGVIGVRSTSLHSWVMRSGKAKGKVCDVDPKWNVNAGSYGLLNQTKNKFVQIGKGPEYQFCKKNKSPFEAMFMNRYYEPKLLIMFFLGNSAQRWANNKDAAIKDVRQTMQQIPENLPCIFMTTKPSYEKKVVDLRLRAQANVKQAFAESGSRCSFIEGFTPKTISAITGNKHYFRLRKNGTVKDPFHPNISAARDFFSIEMHDICDAIFKQIGE